LILLSLQEQFPKRFPFSQFVPRIYSEVKEYIYACLQFSEDLNLRYTTCRRRCLEQYDTFFALIINPSTGTLKPQSNRPCIIQQYGDWYIGCWWVGCYIWYSNEGFSEPNMTAHPLISSVPTSYYSLWHYNYLCTLRG